MIQQVNSITGHTLEVAKEHIGTSALQTLEAIARDEGYAHVGTIGPYTTKATKARVAYVGNRAELGDVLGFDPIQHHPMVIRAGSLIRNAYLARFLLDSSHKNPTAQQRVMNTHQCSEKEARELVLKQERIDTYFDLYGKAIDSTAANQRSLLQAITLFRLMNPRPINGLMVMGRCDSITEGFIQFCQENFEITNIQHAGTTTDPSHATPNFPGEYHDWAKRGNLGIDWSADQFGFQASYPVIFSVGNHETLQKLKSEKPQCTYGF